MKQTAGLLKAMHEMLQEMKDAISTNSQKNGRQPFKNGSQNRREYNNKKSDVFRSALVSRMDIHQARTEVIQEETMAMIDPLRKGIPGEKGRRPAEKRRRPV
jgi:hypothetical protein